MRRGEPRITDPSDHPLRQYRHRHGWSLGDVAKHLVLLGYEHGTNLGATGKLIGRWERGECKPRKPYPEYLCLLYGATPADLGLAPSLDGIPSGTLEVVERRAFMRMLTVAAGAPLLLHGRASAGEAHEGVDVDRLAHALDKPSSADLVTAQGVEQSIAIARRLEDARGARYAVESALHQRAIIQRLLKDGVSGDAVKRRLLVAGGELCQFLAFLSRDLNDREAWRRFLDEALSIAHETDANDLRAYVLGWRGILELDQNRAREAMAFNEAARNWADLKGSPGIRSWLACREAEDAALLGDRSGAERALDRARRTLARVKAGEEPSWLYWLSPDDGEGVWYTQGKTYVTLGLAEPARASLNRYLASKTVPNVRDQAVAFARLGEAHALDKEIDEACRLGRQALTIATDIRSDSAISRVRKLRTRLQPWEHEPAVRNLDDQLAATA